MKYIKSQFPILLLVPLLLSFLYFEKGKKEDMKEKNKKWI